MKRIFIFIVLVINSLFTYSKTSGENAKFTNEDRLIFSKTIEKLIPHANCEKNELMIMVAKEFLETPYVAGTLETVPEILTINLHQTDCILFVENCLAITTLLSSYAQTQQYPTFEEYCDLIQSMRYRGGIVDGYSSRIHYTSEWILQNENRNILYEYTPEFGERAYQTFSFMSTHPGSYKQLKSSPKEVEKIRKAEQNLEKQTKIYTIAAKDIDNFSDQIKDGDIVCFVSKVKGLDITHVGIAYRDNGRLTFIHASSRAKKVIIEPKSLSEYCTTSIRLVRLI